MAGLEDQDFSHAPILKDVLMALRKSDDGKFLMAEDEIPKLQEKLEEVLATDKLRTTVGALVAFSYFMEVKQGSPQVADTLLELLKPAIEELKRQGIDVGSDAAQIAQAGQKFDDFLGQKRQLQAPKVGEKPKKEGLSIADLKKGGGFRA